MDVSPLANGCHPAETRDDKLQKHCRNDDASFDEVLEDCDCRILGNGTDDVEYHAEDPRRLRRKLEQRLTLNERLRCKFLDGAREHLDQQQALRAALKPLVVTGANAIFTGDSLVRTLLNTPPLQKDLSEYILQRIPDFADEAGSFGESASVPQLILGQMRWLDCLVDPHALTATLLEVLPAMPQDVQRDAILFIPEIAPEEDHACVLDALVNQAEESADFLIPVIEAASNLLLTPKMQERLTELMISRLQSANIDDLPAVVGHLLRGIGTSTAVSAADTLAALRGALHFVTITDPRLAVPDRKQKGRMPVPADIPETRILVAMKQAVQTGKGTAEAIVKDIKALSIPESHRILDFWLLLVIACSPSKSAVHTVLRKKFADGLAGTEWVEKAIRGHSMALEDYFASLLALAQQLLGDASDVVTAAGTTLYCILFEEFKEAFFRQEVLRSLHSHLGTSCPSETTAALNVLQQLATSKTAELLHYAAFLTTVLDYVAAYTDVQLTSVFTIFAELVVGVCIGPGGDAGSSQGGGRSRMEDELFIFLRKNLSAGLSSQRRIGASGAVALVQRLGREVEERGLVAVATSGTANAVGQSALPLVERYREARALLDVALAGASSSPESLSFLCDALAQEAERGALPRGLCQELAQALAVTLEKKYVQQAHEYCNNGQRESWWPLMVDSEAMYGGSSSSSVVPLLPPTNAPSLGGNAVHQSTKAIFPLLRAVTALHTAVSGNLSNVDAVLQFGMGLFPMAHARSEVFATLAASSQRSVIFGLFFAVNWCRELLNAFSLHALPRDTTISPNTGPVHSASPAVSQPRPWMTHAGAVMLARARECCQMEAALACLLPLVPQVLVLPTLNAAALRPDDERILPAKRKIATMHPDGRKKASTAKVKFDPGSGGGTARREYENEGHGGNEKHSECTGSGGDSKSRTSSGSQGTALTTTTTKSCISHGTLSTTKIASLPADIYTKMRPLQASSLSALAVFDGSGCGGEHCYVALAPAAYVLSDLVEKLKIKLAPPKKAVPFLTGAKQKTNSALSSLTPTLLLSSLLPVLPAMRRHLNAAVEALDGGDSDADLEAHNLGRMERLRHQGLLKFAPQTLLSVLPECPAASAAVAPTTSAGNVIIAVLEVVKLIFAYHDILGKPHRGVLQRALEAFGEARNDDNTPLKDRKSNGSSSGGSSVGFEGSQWGPSDYTNACASVCRQLLQLAPQDTNRGENITAGQRTQARDQEETQAQVEYGTRAEMERWPAVLAAIEALLKLGTRLASEAAGAGDARAAAKWAKLLATVRRQLSTSAAFLLRHRWVGIDGTEESAGGWKGRGAVLSETIRLSVVYSLDPVREVTHQAREYLSVITPVTTGKDNAQPLEDLPALSGTTVVTWYRTFWEVLLSHWNDVASASASAASSSTKAKNGSKKAKAAQTVEGAPPSPEAIKAIVVGITSSCEAFNELVQLVTMQDKRPMLHTTATKSASTFLTGLLKCLPFLGEVFDDHRDDVVSALKQVQRAARVLHRLCVEGKLRRDLALTARVPALKRSIERFVLAAVTFFRERNPGASVSIGELKHRDLAGQLLETSQLFPDLIGSSGDDDHDDDDDEDDEELVGEGEQDEEDDGDIVGESQYDEEEERSSWE